MRILIASLLKRKVVPDVRSSRPRIIFEIVSGLIRKGHAVSYLGTADSLLPGAELIPIAPGAMVDLPPFENQFYGETSYLVQMTKKIEALASSFDIIHNHTYPEFINLLSTDIIKTPMVTTIHAQGTPELDEVLSLFPNTYLISISQAHKKLFRKTKIFDVVHNGIDTEAFAFEPRKEDYLLWLGRLARGKNPDGSFMDPKGIKWAIQLAQASESKLLLSGNVEDVEFFNRDVKPYLNDKIRWVGPVSSELALDRKEVIDLMKKAKAYLMTINWYEPFGLVMAEAMSTGTPVIGFDRGAVSELVVDGKTGFVVPPEAGLDGLKKALEKINAISPQDCRQHVVDNFSVEKMVESYERIYQKITGL